MKVRAVGPGTVYSEPDGWTYTYKLNNIRTVHTTERFDSASAAKQAMREKVAHERKRHGLTEGN